MRGARGITSDRLSVFEVVRIIQYEDSRSCHLDLTVVLCASIFRWATQGIKREPGTTPFQRMIAIVINTLPLFNGITYRRVCSLHTQSSKYITVKTRQYYNNDL